jgi:hypothetical protein
MEFEKFIGGEFKTFTLPYMGATLGKSLSFWF